jgi:hypothetical protein
MRGDIPPFPTRRPYGVVLSLLRSLLNVHDVKLFQIRVTHITRMCLNTASLNVLCVPDAVSVLLSTLSVHSLPASTMVHLA